MKTAALILAVVFCTDIRWGLDRCFSTAEKAAEYCDSVSLAGNDVACVGLYERGRTA